MGQYSGNNTYTITDGSGTREVTVTFTGNYDANQFGPFINGYDLNIPCDVAANPALLNQLIQQGLNTWTTDQVLNTRDESGVMQSPGQRTTETPSDKAQQLIDNAKDCAKPVPTSELDPDVNVTASVTENGNGSASLV